MVTSMMALLVSPSSMAAGPKLTLSTQDRLDHDQPVVVNYSGMTPNEEVRIQQCKQGATVASQCGGTTYAAADSTGSGNLIFRVTRTNGSNVSVPAAPFLLCDEENLCEIRVASLDDLTNFVSQDITFVPDAGSCPKGLPGAVTGKGTAALARAFVSWGPVTCEDPISVSVDYVAESDKFGLDAFACGLVDYAITDQGLGANTCAADGSSPKVAGLAPIALTGISFAFNIRDGDTGQRVETLKLTSNLLTRIFTGQLSTLDTAEIRALNPGVDLPNKLFVSVRADQSAATLSVTEYFHATNKETYLAGGRQNDFAGGPTDIYPQVPGVEPVSGEPKVLSSLTNPDPSPADDTSFGWIGYLSTAAAAFGALPSVTIVDSAGEGGLKPTVASFSAAFKEATKAADGSYQFDYTPSNPKSYPLTTISSMVLPQLPAGDAKIKTFESFIEWAVIEGQRGEYLPQGYAPLPGLLSASAISISKSISQAPTPTTSPTPTPTPSASSTTTTPTFTNSFGSGSSTTTIDSGIAESGGVTTTTEAVRLSAFSESQVSSSPLGRLLVFVLLGLFAGSAISTVRLRK